MPLPPILITGASGFVGDRLLQRVRTEEFDHLYCVGRKCSPTMQALSARAGVTCLEAEFPGRPLPNDVLRAVDTVLHLAAATGKARPETYVATNVTGTRELLAQSARCGVRNFLFVSTIAARFKDITHYPYAQSKRDAEVAVAEGGLPFVIVRPTIVAGPAGGAWKGLLRLARLPLTPLFGTGKAQAQPIWVDDLTEGLLAVIRERTFRNETLELGGPEVVSIEELLRRLRLATGRRAGNLLRLPLGLLRKALARAERWLGPVLPLTAGQLSTFAEDSTVEPNALFARLAPCMKTVDQMISLAITGEEGR